MTTRQLPSTYSVKRNSVLNYTIGFNLELNGNQTIRDNIQSCLKEVNNIGLGSDDQNIFLKLYEPNDPGPLPKKIHILTLKDIGRANARMFSERMSCTTIVHEMLHSAGLVDEYSEQDYTGRSVFGLSFYLPVGGRRTKKPAYDCRSLSDSIMGDRGIEPVTSKKFLTTRLDMMCACPINTNPDYCKTEIDKFVKRSRYRKQTSCPIGMEKLELNKSSDLPEPVYHDGKDERFYGDHFLLHSYLQENPHLRPGHIRKLLWPQCKSKNNFYDQCASNSYKTSKKNGGTGCLPTPSQCKHVNTWLD